MFFRASLLGFASVTARQSARIIKYFIVCLILRFSTLFRLEHRREYHGVHRSCGAIPDTGRLRDDHPGSR
jgi:hypothetical protein